MVSLRSRKRPGRIVQSLVLAAAGVAILVYTLWNTPWTDFKSALHAVQPAWLLALGAVIFFSHFLRAWRWQLLFQKENQRPRLWACFHALMAGYLVNLIPPRAGEIVRAALLSRSADIPMEKILGTVLLERLLDLVTLLILFIPTLGFSGPTLHHYAQIHILEPLNASQKIFWMGGLTFLLIAAVAFFILLKSPWGMKNVPVLNRFWEGLTAFLTLQKPFLFLFLTLAIWGCYWLVNLIGFQSVGLFPEQPAAAALALMTVGTIGMIVTPGGTIYPLMAAGILSLWNVSYKESLLLGWLLWGSQMLLFLALGALAFFILPLTKSRHAQHASKH